MESSNIPHVQVRFFAKQPKYAVPDTPYSVPANVQSPQLSSLINSVLQADAGSDGDRDAVEFDFLINNELLRVDLQEHMQMRDISTESVVDIEYLERQAAPEPEDSLQHDDWVAAVHSAADYILTGCYDNTLHIWNTDGKSLLTIPSHTAPVKCVSWLRQDADTTVRRFVSGSHDQTLLLWDWNSKTNSVECAHVCRGHAGSVDCVATNPSSTQFCSGSWDKMLKIWSTVIGTDDEVEEEEVPEKKKKKDKHHPRTRIPVMTLSGHSEGISSALWTSDVEVCTSSWDHTIRIWDIESARHKSTIEGAKVYLDISYSPLNHLLVAASADRHVRLYDPRTTEGAVVKCTFTSHTGWVTGVDWSPSNEHLFISGSYDSIMKIWDTRSPKAPLYDMAGHEDKILAVDWSLPRYILSAGADNNLKIFCHSETKPS